MRRRFSHRYGYDESRVGTPIIEDAPTAIRFEYLKTILEPRLYVDQDSRYPNAERRPLPAKILAEELSALVHQEPDEKASDSWYCIGEVKNLFNQATWYQFYDMVEHIAWRLKKLDSSQARTEFAPYREALNELFSSQGVVWRMDLSGQLERPLPEELSEAAAKTADELKADFPPAYKAYVKARRFLGQQPLDPENAIKEIVSSIESVGRSMFPGTKTLGDVVKKMTTAGFPPLMASVIEKFYAFASAMPAVRHGGTSLSGLTLADADFCLHVGTAMIRYLLEFRKLGTRS